MSNLSDWVNDCMKWHGHVLTGNFRHWCAEWDDLPIDNTCKEFEACHCNFEEVTGLDWCYCWQVFWAGVMMEILNMELYRP